MTPHIIRNEADAEAIKRAEAARMSWCLCDITPIYGEAGLRKRTDQWSDAETAVIYPDAKPAPATQPGPRAPLEPIPVPTPAPASKPAVKPPAGGPAAAAPPGDPNAAMRQAWPQQQAQYPSNPPGATGSASAGYPSGVQPANYQQPPPGQPPPQQPFYR